MRHVIITLFGLLLTTALASAADETPTAAPRAGMQDMPMPMAQHMDGPSQLQLDMWKLWEDHLFYTRNYVISALAGLPDAETVAQRLMQNQDEIGAAIAPYYGEAAGNQLSELLREHIAFAAEAVGAAKSKDTAAFKSANERWRANAEAIATFLSDANPHWTKQDLSAMMNMHLDLLTAQVTARLKQDWDEDIRNSDLNHDHMLMFSDALTAGIIAQFPDRFELASGGPQTVPVNAMSVSDSGDEK